MPFYIETILRRGATHEVFCQDFLTVVSDSRYCLAAVFDGCSSGKDSQFAAQLYAKLFEQMGKAMLAEQIDPISLERAFFEGFIEKFTQRLVFLQKELALTTNDLLTTMGVVMVCQQTQKGFAAMLGDGLLMVDDEKYHFDHDNIPDYLAYYLEDCPQVKSLYASKQLVFFDKADKISLCTDGIFSFVEMKNPAQGQLRETVPEYLLSDQRFAHTANPLNRLYNLLMMENKIHTDDLAMIRLVWR